MTTYPYIGVQQIQQEGPDLARQRTIDPGFFRNEDLAELPFEARLLFAGLWTQADRKGLLEDRPKRLKADVFPYDSVDVDAALTSLASRQMIRRYTVNGAPLIAVLNFPKFQRCHPHERASVLPGPELADLAVTLATIERTSPPGPSGSSGSSGPSGSSELIVPNGTHSTVGRVGMVESVYLAFLERHPQAQRTPARDRLIGGFVKSHGGDVCVAAVQGIVHSPHHMGDNERGTVYDSLEVIFKNAKNVETFSGYTLNPTTRPTGRPRGKVERDIRGQELDPDTAEYAFRVTS